jgi:hypothetical protein
VDLRSVVRGLGGDAEVGEIPYDLCLRRPEAHVDAARVLAGDLGLARGRPAHRAASSPPARLRLATPRWGLASCLRHDRHLPSSRLSSWSLIAVSGRRVSIRSRSPWVCMLITKPLRRQPHTRRGGVAVPKLRPGRRPRRWAF